MTRGGVRADWERCQLPSGRAAMSLWAGTTWATLRKHNLVRTR